MNLFRFSEANNAAGRGFPCGRPANRSHWSLPKTIACPPLNSAGKIRALAESLLATALIHASKERQRRGERKGGRVLSTTTTETSPYTHPCRYLNTRPRSCGWSENATLRDSATGSLHSELPPRSFVRQNIWTVSFWTRRESLSGNENCWCWLKCLEFWALTCFNWPRQQFPR